MGNKSNRTISKPKIETSNEKVIVGIDFGTSGIAYAYSFYSKVNIFLTIF